MQIKHDSDGPLNSSTLPAITAIVPAAGIGSRMAAKVAKQYLLLGEQTVLEHTLSALLAHPRINRIVVVLHPEDDTFAQLPLAQHPQISTVIGGAERVDSVLQGLYAMPDNHWVLVHDAARPCIQQHDIDALLSNINDVDFAGAILATPVIDTMKRARQEHQTPSIEHTVDRESLWHALTPQLFASADLTDAIVNAQAQQHLITDEASAMEYAGYHISLVSGDPSNIKITRPEDLALAHFFLTQQGRIT